jgi:hypothetical protein
MAEVKMDLKELEAIKNEINVAKQETENVRKELNEKINKIQDEKTELISNQKRVLFTKKVFDVKQYLPCTFENLEKAIADAMGYAFQNDYFYRDEILRIRNFLISFFKSNCTFEKLSDTMTLRDDKEEHFEFINLDDAINLALKQEDNEYTQQLRNMKKLNAKLQSKIDNYNIDKDKEIDNIIRERDNRYSQLELDSSKKYNELKKSSEDKYKKLEEEFAKYKDDEAKMNIQDKLDKYKKENDELKKKLEEMDKKLKSKGLLSKIFG